MVRKEENPFSICCWFIQVLMVWGFVTVVIWLCTRPQIPELTITSVYVPQTASKNLSKVEQNKTDGNNSLVFVLEISNPNKGMTICYADIIINIQNGDFLAGNKSVEAFCQDQKTVTEEVLIVNERKFHGPNVGGGESLRVTVETKARYHILKWKTKIHHMYFEGFMRIGKEGNVSENIYLHKTHY